MITRKTAEQHIVHLRMAAAAINAGDFAYRVVRLEVFGSYLSDKEQLGDLDVLVTLAPRPVDDNEHHHKRQERIRLAFRQGRRFQNYTSEAYWPTEEVHRLLKAGKRSISIHDSGERTMGLVAAYYTIFEAVAE